MKNGPINEDELENSDQRELIVKSHLQKNYLELNTKMPTTISKDERLSQLARLPVSVYDMTGGQAREENGYGYNRSLFVIDDKVPVLPNPKKREFRHKKKQPVPNMLEISSIQIQNKE